jgi:acyl-coenzyme A thioesterase PaaI-like protein
MNRIVRALDTPPVGKLLFNLYPPYLMTGITIREIARDWRRVVVSMGLHWYNRNYFGTHFGASLYAMTDPFYLIMLARNLGPEYIVWDLSAKIDFVRPGRGRVWAEFVLEPQLIAAVVEATAAGEKHQPSWAIEVCDEAGEVIARVQKTLYVRRKQAPQESAR